MMADVLKDYALKEHGPFSSHKWGFVDGPNAVISVETDFGLIHFNSDQLWELAQTHSRERWLKGEQGPWHVSLISKIETE